MRLAAGLGVGQCYGAAATKVEPNLSGQGEAAILNIHLHCLVLDEVYRCSSDGASAFLKARAPTDDAMHAPLQTMITWLMELVTRRGVLVDVGGQTYLTEPHADVDEARTMRPLQRLRQ